MKATLLLSAALVLMVPALPEAAYAQTTSGGVDKPQANTRAAKRARDAKDGNTAAETPLYPNATREAPKQKSDAKMQKKMAELFKLQEGEGNEDKIIAAADGVLADPNAGAYDKSAAAYLAANAWQGKDAENFDNPIKYYKLAVDNNGLGNNNHFRTMLQLTQMYAAEDKFAEAQAMLDRFKSETKHEDDMTRKVEAQLLLGQDKPAEAAVVFEKMYAANPGDKKTAMNLASLYQQSSQDAKAIAVFEKMRAAGQLTEQRDYEVGFSLLANMDGKEKDAVALVEEGEKKGVLKPTSSMYSFIGRTYYDADNIPKAIEIWSKGLPTAKDGELALNLGQLQSGEERWADAKASARAALDKGVRRPGVAWQVIGQAEEGLGNKAAALAAFREAAKYPETKKWADSKIRQAGAK